DVKTAAYRIVQEALTNVARYAHTPEVTVRLWQSQGWLGVQIEDAGIGFDFDSIGSGNPSGGLSGMEERATLLGVTLPIERRRGRGTCITAEIPLTLNSTPPAK